MADFTQINQEIDDNIKQNGVNEITGAKMNTVLKDMVSSVNNEKQDIISDLDEIRSGAEAGATAFQKPSEGIPSTDMDEQVQAALDNAENAVLYSKQSVGITDQQRNTALANVSNQTANSSTGKMGYKVLDPTKTFASQVTAENTIYEIRDVFDLNNGSVTIPSGCSLKFEGGKIVNGTIEGSDTAIIDTFIGIFDDTTNFSGTWDVLFARPEWFAPSDVYDFYGAIQKCLDSANDGLTNKVVLLGGKTYYISASVEIPNNVTFGGQEHISKSYQKAPKIKVLNTNVNDFPALVIGTSGSAYGIIMQELFLDVNVSSSYGAIEISNNCISAINNLNFSSVSISGFLYGIKLERPDIPNATGLSISNITINNFFSYYNSVGIPVFIKCKHQGSENCYLSNIIVENSFITESKIGGIRIESDFITGNVVIRNCILEGNGNNYSLSNYNTYGCFGLYIEGTNTSCNAVSVEDCYFESNCPIDLTTTERVPDTSGDIGGFIEGLSSTGYTYITNPNYEKTGEIVVKKANVNITRTHFSFNFQLATLVNYGHFSMKQCSYMQPGSTSYGISMIQPALLKVLGHDTSDYWNKIFIEIDASNLSSNDFPSNYLTDITEGVEFVGNVFPLDARIKIDFDVVGEKINYGNSLSSNVLRRFAYNDGFMYMSSTNNYGVCKCMPATLRNVSIYAHNGRALGEERKIRQIGNTTLDKGSYGDTTQCKQGYKYVFIGDPNNSYTTEIIGAGCFDTNGADLVFINMNLIIRGTFAGEVFKVNNSNLTFIGGSVTLTNGSNDYGGFACHGNNKIKFVGTALVGVSGNRLVKIFDGATTTTVMNITNVNNLVIEGSEITNGITAERPSNLSQERVGFQFFDKTLYKPIWWNGTGWVDATGATV